MFECLDRLAWTISSGNDVVVRVLVITKGRGAGRMVHDGVSSQPIRRSLDRIAAFPHAVVPNVHDVRPVAVVRRDCWAESDNLLRSTVAVNDECKSPLAPWWSDNRDDVDVFVLSKPPVARKLRQLWSNSSRI